MKYTADEWHGEIKKVLVNGKEIKDCYEADDKRCYALVYKRNQKGLFYLEDNEVAKEKIYGKVEIIF